MFNKKYIICSAIWFKDGIERIHQPKNIKSGIVICGRRHHNCYNIIFSLLGKDNELKKGEHIQGFITSDDMFVDRTEAAKIAYESGQIKDISDTLISEDIY